MITWLICTLAFSGLAALAAYLVETAVPPSRQRRSVWIAAAMASVLVPLLALAAGDAWPRGVLLPGASELRLLPDPTPFVPEAPSSGDVGSAAISAMPPTALSATTFTLAAWGLLSTLVLFLYAAVWLRFAGAAGEWRRTRLIGRDVFVASEMGPAVFGVLRPHIVVPEWVLTAPPAVQRMVMLHEVEHARARDHVLLGIAPVVLVLMPWNLPLWWQLHRMRLAIEVDCDARVLRSGVAVRDYGSLLIDIAGRSTPMPRALAALSGSRTLLERRIVAMSMNRSPRSPLRSAAGLAAAALLAVTAFETFTFRASETHAQSAMSQVAVQPGTTEAHSRVAGILTTAADTPLVVIDGVIVAATDVQSTVGKATIVGVEVIADADAVAQYGERARNGVIFITTARSPAAAVQAVEASVASAAATARAAEATVAAAGYSVIRLGPAGPLGTLEERQAAAERMVVELRAAREAEAAYERGVIIARPASEGTPPLFVIDGVVMPATFDRDAMDLQSVDSISVLKGERAVSLYGERGASGVIIVKTRKEGGQRQ